MTTELPGVTSVLDLIEAQPPDTPAVVSGEVRLTYRDLDERANHLAHRLRDLGVRAEERVGVLMERSAETLIAVLAVWKVGAACLPVDLDNPLPRRRFILKEAGVRLVVTDDRHAAEPPGLPVRKVVLDGGRSQVPPKRSIPQAGLCYVVYTSGSTGTPKGVLVTHQGLLTTYLAWERAFSLRGRITAHTQMANFGFDGFFGELVRTLCSGATLVVCPKETLLQPVRLLALMREEGVDAADFVPPVLRALIQHLGPADERLDFLKMIIVGSDKFQAAELNRVQNLSSPATQVVNCYGVSEATIDSTVFTAPCEERHGDAVLIGTALPGTRVWILDDRLRPVPSGVTGTLYLAGSTVARGYLGDPARTAERFIAHPLSSRPGERLYRTGDRARYHQTENGPQIEFLGREDHQLNIRGYRVEPGEIEAVLRRLPDVREAVVTESDGICAHLVVADPHASTTWDALARELLPRYMRPTRFIVHARLPMTGNGKLDRAALAELAATSRQQPRSPLRTTTERGLAEIWSQVLGRSDLGGDEDFFAAGGDSFLAAKVIALVVERWRLQPPVRTLFSNPTLAGFAAVIDRLSAEGARSAGLGEIVPMERELIEDVQ